MDWWSVGALQSAFNYLPFMYSSKKKKRKTVRACVLQPAKYARGWRIVAALCWTERDGERDESVCV